MFNRISHINLLKTANYIPVLLCAAMVILLPFSYDERLMDAIQSTKTFWFAGFVVAIVNLTLIWKLFIYKTGWSIKLLDLVLFIYFIYTIAHPYIFNYGVAPHVWIETLSLATFYFIIRQFPQNQLRIFLFGIMVSCMVQAIYGSLQLYGFYPSNHALFNITGSFFNPGPFAGYIVVGLPIALGILIYTKEQIILREEKGAGNKEHGARNMVQGENEFKHKIKSITQNPVSSLHSSISVLRSTFFKSRFLYYFSQLVIVSILLVLPASRSRAAWVGGALGCLWISWKYKNEIKNYLIKHLKLSKYAHFLNTKYIVLSFLLITIPSFALVYKFKQSSADGRLLIWKVSAKMISDKPIFGHGVDKFNAYYMNYQADYFKNNPDSPEIMFADNVQYAYNEFVKVGVEKGIFGLTLFLFVFFVTIFNVIKQNKGTKDHYLLISTSSILTITGFSMFGYPSEILPIKVLIVSMVAIIGSKLNGYILINNTRLASYFKYVLTIIYITTFGITCYLPSSVLSRNYKAYISWKDASDIYDVKAYKECLDDFELAYPLLKNDGEFLIQYGKTLEMSKYYLDASNVFSLAKNNLNNTILYIALSNSYKETDRFKDAEQGYTQAYYMIPSRLYPLYLLAKLYDENNQSVKALETAKKLLKKKAKIDSKAIEQIKTEMQTIINKYESSINKVKHEGKWQEANKRKHTASHLTPSPNTKKGGDVTKIITN